MRRARPATGNLHVLTDTTLQRSYTHAELAALAVEGGADTIQFRSKEQSMRRLIDLATPVVELCRAAGVLCLINDRVDLALALGADGVHLGREDMPIPLARQLLGPGRVIGGTVRDRRQLLEAAAAGADYVGVGPIFATGTKEVGHPPLGLARLRELASDAPLPVIAIAGITGANVAGVIAAGAYGVAVIGAVATAEDPRQATAELRREVDAALTDR